MLKKIRRRFIGAAMTAFSVVILLLLFCVNFWNYSNILGQLDHTLLRLLESQEAGRNLPPDQNLPPIDGAIHDSGEIPYMIRFFSVRFDSEGRLLDINQDYIASVSEEEAAAMAGDILARSRVRGFRGCYRYLTGTDGDTTVVIFLNAEREIRAVRDLCITTLLIFTVCLAIVFLLVVLLSRRAAAPYMRNLEMQKRFITNAGHELKTPLTAISTSADVLAMEYEEDEWVQNIQLQSEKMAKLIAGLVTLSRLNEENPFPEKVVFSLSDALWEAADPFVSLIRATGRSFTLEIEDHLSLTGDPASIQQMIGILLDNAMKYSPEGSSIRLNAGRSGRKIRIEVSNPCDDIEDAELPHLFERFYRAEKTRSGAAGGSGIGLSIAKAAAEAHGGSIRAEKSGNRIRFLILL